MISVFTQEIKDTVKKIFWTETFYIMEKDPSPSDLSYYFPYHNDEDEQLKKFNKSKIAEKDLADTPTAHLISELRGNWTKTIILSYKNIINKNNKYATAKSWIWHRTKFWWEEIFVFLKSYNRKFDENDKSKLNDFTESLFWVVKILEMYKVNELIDNDLYFHLLYQLRIRNYKPKH